MGEEGTLLFNRVIDFGADELVDLSIGFMSAVEINDWTASKSLCERIKNWSP